ncbi:hypothetical protein Tco_0664774 [Tanacetum coccineum]
MLLCKQAEKGVPLQVEQADWLEDTDEEIDEQELEAHYSYMAKIQEVLVADSRTDIEALEHWKRLIVMSFLVTIVIYRVLSSRPMRYSISEDPEDESSEEEPLKEPKEEG